jgi:hypothetical protein
VQGRVSSFKQFPFGLRFPQKYKLLLYPKPWRNRYALPMDDLALRLRSSILIWADRKDWIGVPPGPCDSAGRGAGAANSPELLAAGAELSYAALTAFCRRHGVG